MRSIKPLALAIALVAPLHASANLQEQVNSMFGSLINTTGAGSYQTATRGVITGGGIVLRNRISTANLIAITPPSAKGGCGGINLYTGSFSFINGEEFVALMRNVASNSVGVVSGYAFEAALEYMDAATAGIIRGLRNTIQQLNEMFSNSCQLASGIVAGGKKALEEHKDLKLASQAFLENVTSDFFSSKTATASSPAERVNSAGKMRPCIDTGNVMWCALTKVGLASQIVFGSNENAEFIMSMTGSRLITMGTDAKGERNLTSSPLQAIVTDKGLDTFINGTEDSDQKIWSCEAGDTELCMEPRARDLGTFKGLRQRIVEDVRNSGVLERFAVGQAVPADADRLRYLATSSVGSNLFKVLQQVGPEQAMVYFEEFAHVIALNAAYSAINEMLSITNDALGASEFAEALELREEVRETQRRIANEWRTELLNGTNFRDADKRAAEILNNANTEDQGKNQQGINVQSAGS